MNTVAFIDALGALWKEIKADTRHIAVGCGNAPVRHGKGSIDGKKERALA